MAEQNGTRGAGIAKGGYKPKPYRNETGMERTVMMLPNDVMRKIKDTAIRENSSFDSVAAHAISEYFKAISWNS